MHRSVRLLWTSAYCEWPVAKRSCLENNVRKRRKLENIPGIGCESRSASSVRKDEKYRSEEEKVFVVIEKKIISSGRRVTCRLVRGAKYQPVAIVEETIPSSAVFRGKVRSWN